MMRRAEIDPRPRFHDLRHGFATRLLEAGVHPKVVSEALGHASVAFTMDRYQHVMPTMQAQAAEAIQQLSEGARAIARPSAADVARASGQASDDW